MDDLTDLLNGVRTSGAVFHQAFLSGNWALRFEDGSPMALATLLRGSAWVTAQGGNPVRLRPGDIAVLAGGTPYAIASDPANQPDVVVRTGGRCTTPDGEELLAPPVSGVGTWGTDHPDSTVLVSGLYTMDVGRSRPLSAALPPVAVVQVEPGSCPVSPAAFDSDAVVGPVLRLLHANPAHPWTLDALAAKAGVSRAHLARRFTAIVGQPPMTYLRESRLTLAAELLCDPQNTLATVATQVGFSSAFALSTAFKRHHGVSPAKYRALL